MIRPHLAYEIRYGYSLLHAIQAEFWWRVEHVGWYRRGNGGVCGRIRAHGYKKRKQAERRATE